MQEMSDLRQYPSEAGQLFKLRPIISPLPFAKWGMDILGPFPKASGQGRFVLVAVDYFTKWVDAGALRNITTNDVKGFICRNRITRDGVPQSIVFDNGPQFSTPQLKEWLADLGISAHFAAVGHPQSNGQVEEKNLIRHQKEAGQCQRPKGRRVAERTLAEPRRRILQENLHSRWFMGQRPSYPLRCMSLP